MKLDKVMITSGMSLRSRVKAYKERAAQMKNYLDQNPNEWGRFQSEFNQEINGIFRDLMLFEKENLLNGNEEKVYRLRQLFVKKFQKDFVQGPLLKWSLEKPYGYAGDHKIIDEIYKNEPMTTGFERLFDNYYQMSVISTAVRNRMKDFKKIIFDSISGSSKSLIKIMVLASGPCREICEALQSNVAKEKKVVFHCYDSDQKAHEYARNLLLNDSRVTFSTQNAVRIALKKDVEKAFEERYNLIYSTGLFDYLDYGVSIRLVSNLKKLLAPDGRLAISDVRDKFSNPSIYFMEWVADWNLIYRDDDNFRDIFLNAGFSLSDLLFQYEQQGVMQYILAKNS